jgi:hypothetical protein
MVLRAVPQVFIEWIAKMIDLSCPSQRLSCFITVSRLWFPIGQYASNHLKNWARDRTHSYGFSPIVAYVAATNRQDTTPLKLRSNLFTPWLRFSDTTRPVPQIGIVAGRGSEPEIIREAIDLGCDTFVTGERCLYGPGEDRAANRARMRDFLIDTDIHLVGTSHYAVRPL